jgi:hypothetical protein
MKTDSSKGKRGIVLAAAALIGAGTILFQGLTQTAVAAEYNKSAAAPTSYVSETNPSSGTAQRNLPEGYKKANYTVKNIDLDYYKNQKPTDKDMTKQDAAEIGAQALWSVYGLSLEGKAIELGYDKAHSSFPRSSWCGDVTINKKSSYSFKVDSVTGELFSVVRTRTLDKNVSVGLDLALAKNPQKYAAAAKKTAEKLNVVHGAIAAAEYNCQGYTNNDPDITFVVKGENGEAASMTFSRYDKALLSIGYPASYQYDLKELGKLEQETRGKAEAETNGLTLLKGAES